MTLLAELEEFVHDHHPHGTLIGDATEPAWNGDLLTVACTCGVTFERWVTPEDATVDPCSPICAWPGTNFHLPLDTVT
jgi:hypothetical protein